MASLTVRNVPEDAKRRFRLVAAAHGRSMEEHLRQMVIEASFAGEPDAARVAEAGPSFRHAGDHPASTGSPVIDRLVQLGRGLEFEPPPRTVERLDPPDFA
ncbi:MAG: hypothetical protein ABW203_02380 [Novosphingobium sp.]